MNARASLIALGSVIAMAAACRAPAWLTGPRLTGTCDGACDHYLDCRGGDRSDAARNHCVSECRDVFSDDESLRAYESLSCPDAVEYVEGSRRHAAR